ncbi:MAG TPA: STAS domain-containing protein [Vicinamibacterales bacterium]|nr:STAS domain-containing protein [Vicinamibacterales bacterium]
MPSSSRLPQLVRMHQAEVLEDWMMRQSQSLASRRDLIPDANRLRESEAFLEAFIDAIESSEPERASGPAWDRVHEMLDQLSVARARLGFSPSETATFVFSLKQPLFDLIRRSFTSPDELARETWQTTVALDRLGLSTTEFYQRGREEIIQRQQQSMLELSTPVVTLWHGILALPLIGTLDSERTQVVMESLLRRIVETGASIAILDITGVPTVDTLVAQHLLKTVAAARLMGADCIISGIRPQIAQTIVHLGVDLNNVVTKATLADAFAVALKRNGLAVTPTSANGAKPSGKPAPAQPSEA